MPITHCTPSDKKKAPQLGIARFFTKSNHVLDVDNMNTPSPTVALGTTMKIQEITPPIRMPCLPPLEKKETDNKKNETTPKYSKSKKLKSVKFDTRNVTGIKNILN